MSAPRLTLSQSQAREVREIAALCELGVVRHPVHRCRVCQCWAEFERGRCMRCGLEGTADALEHVDGMEQC